MTNTFKLISLLLIITIYSCGNSGGDDIDNESADNIKPTITCLADINVSITSTESEVVVAYTLPTVTDNIGATITQINGISSGEKFPLGTTTNNFQAKDDAGNTANCSFNITVTRDEPLSSLPYLSISFL